MARSIFVTARNYRPVSLVVLVLLSLQLGLSLLGPAPVQASAASFVRAQGDRLLLNGQPITLKGSNFYPLNHSFVAMWNHWDAELVRDGLQRVAELGGNTVRILVPFTPAHGWTSREDGAANPERLEILQQFLQIAAEFNLRTIVTLFDFEDFAPPDSDQERRHQRYARDIVTLLRNDDRVLAWDLHNEPDHYGLWKTQNDPEPALVWLARMREYVRSLDPNHLITIGAGKRQSFFRKSSQGHSLLSLSDFLSHHSYNADALAEEIYEFQQRTNRQKPIVLEEMGWPSGPIFSTSFKESIQAEKYRKTLETAKFHRIAGVLQWMLYDAEPMGNPPWDDIGNYYGLVRRNGTLKPAALVWRDSYPGTKLPRPATVTSVPLTRKELRKSNSQYFPQTDRHVGGVLLDLWREGGGVEVFGYPLTETFLTEDIGGGRHQFGSEGDKGPVYQYFEKARLEYYPKRRASSEFEVLRDAPRLAQNLWLVERSDLGRELAAARNYKFTPAQRRSDDSETYLWFSKTDHSLQEPFLGYWRTHHGGRLFGVPLSEAFEETNPETGQRLLVQYFEKSRLEYRPEFASTSAAIIVGNVGAELLKMRGWVARANLDYEPTVGATPLSLWSAPGEEGKGRIAAPAFATLWQRGDKPVAEGRAARPWLWGAKPLLAAYEPYEEAPGGVRLVQYWAKSRMELTRTASDPVSREQVTNGLLVREMVTGRVQVGDKTFQALAPAAIPLAGDPANSNSKAPTYASLNRLTGPESDRTGQPVDKMLLKDGSLAPAPAGLAQRATLAHFQAESGHNIAGVFWNFLVNTHGPVFEQGQTVTGDAVNWLSSFGPPLTEPYWTRTRVAGLEKEVLVQAFERRVLTFTPANPPALHIEITDAGLHYWSWRNGGAFLSVTPEVASPEQSLDPATKTELNGSGGLIYRQLDNAAFYRYTPLAGEAATAGAFPGSSEATGAPLSGPGLLYLAPDGSGRQTVRGADFSSTQQVSLPAASAALSPDRERLAYTTHRTELFVHNLANGNQELLASSVLPGLAWSADGQKLAFYSKEANRVKIALSENGSEPRFLHTTEPDTLAGAPIFSPDGQWLLYTLLKLRPDERGPSIIASEIHAIELSTGADKLIAERAARPTFSLDGARLAYLGWQDNTLWLAGWSTQGKLVAPTRRSAALGCEMTCANVGNPAFSPDGKWLAFTGPGRNLLAIRPAGGPAYSLAPRTTEGAFVVQTADPVWIRP